MKKKTTSAPADAPEIKPLRLMDQEYKPEYPVTKLLEHPDNPRLGNLNSISDSMDVNGFYGAIIVQRSTGYVLAGNHRLREANIKGAKKLPIFLINCDDTTARRILLADNRTSDLGEYNPQLLLDQLNAILANSTAESELDALLGSGYTLGDMKDLQMEIAAANPVTITEDNPGPLIDQAEQLKEKWQTAPGQVWELRKPETCPHCGGEN